MTKLTKDERLALTNSVLRGWLRNKYSAMVNPETTGAKACELVKEVIKEVERLI